jgi:DnaK suppressor protein
MDAQWCHGLIYPSNTARRQDVKTSKKSASKVAKPQVQAKSKTVAAKKPVPAKTKAKAAVPAKAAPKASVKAAPQARAVSAKGVSKAPAKAAPKGVAKASPKKVSVKAAVKAVTTTKTPAKPASKAVPAKKAAATTPVAAVKTKPVAPAAKKTAVVAAKTSPAVKAKAAPAPSAKKTAAASQVKPMPVTKVEPVKAPAAPAPATPAPDQLVRATRPSARLAQITVPSLPPAVASTAAKASFLPSAPAPVSVPFAPIKKDAKLANNWKNKKVEDLTDAEVLAMPDAEYMNDVQMAYFRRKLVLLKQDILNSAGETTEHLREDTVVVPDPADRATIEEEHALELRTRDRERKLLKKIEQSIIRIDAGDYGFCDETGEAIGVGRLLARPTATLSLEAQQRRELKQKMFGD